MPAPVLTIFRDGYRSAMSPLFTGQVASEPTCGGESVDELHRAVHHAGTRRAEHHLASALKPA
jgi:hypothetical protein